MRSQRFTQRIKDHLLISAGRTDVIKVLRLTLIFWIAFVIRGNAQSSDDVASVTELKKLSFEELLNVEVTSVSMRPEKLTEVASAVQVITRDQILRSGVTRLPEALRLVSNLQMTQANSHDWAITARGFDGLPSSGGIFANKLLVMIDGRTIYNPLLGGVYWDVQNILLEDIERIEVVSGPGGTLWGANAVNGVINIVTRNSKDSQGLYASASTGSFLKDAAQLRYGFRLGKNMYMRAYGQRLDQRRTLLPGDKTAHDQWKMTQGGFRMDYSPSSSSNLTLQGDFYNGTENDSVKLTHTDGQNIITRFTQGYKNQSDLAVQVFFDRTWRETPDSKTRFYYQLSTFDADVRYRLPVIKNNSVLVGIAYRFQRDNITASLVPLSRPMPLYSGFVQDEITIVPDAVKLTIGSKFLNNVFSGFEAQPSARLAWTPNFRNTLWVSVSKAVRVPTRFDSDITVTAKRFDSEKVIAYEAGYRFQPIENVAVSLATFFNHYNDLRSLDTANTSPPTIVLANSQKAESYGVEFSVRYQATEKWFIRGGYTYFDKSIWAISPKVLPLSKSFEGVDFKGYGMLQSVLDIGRNWQFDVVTRYLTSLPAATPTTPPVHAYFTFDARLGWLYKKFEVSVVGQNLLEQEHTETGLSRIPRTIYAKVTCRF